VKKENKGHVKNVDAESGRLNLWRKQKAGVEVRVPMCDISRAALSVDGSR
jgi:hypothetical protein